MLLMLEDERERLEQFIAVLNSLGNPPTLRVWDDANQMIAEAPEFLSETVLVSLDHDLMRKPGRADPGDGYQLAKWLTSQPIVVPVMIHSSNSVRATWMAGEFDLNGWPHFRVMPFGENWVHDWWLPTVRQLLPEVI